MADDAVSEQPALMQEHVKYKLASRRNDMVKQPWKPENP
jgi:hypothetical protein